MAGEDRDEKVIDAPVRRVDAPAAHAGGPPAIMLGGGSGRGAGDRSDLGGPPPEEVAPSNLRRPLWIGLLVVFVGFGGFLAWSGLAPLDEGIPAMGQVAVQSKRKTVQHLTGGIVRELKVREGDTVKAGQVLLSLDPQATRAAREAADAQYLVSRASEARLAAEQRGATEVTFPPDLLARKDEPTVAQMLATQRDLFRSRRTALESEQASFRESIAGLESQIYGLQQVERERQEQIALYEREVAALAPLVEEGLYPRNRHQELRRQLAMAYAQRADGTAAVARARNQIAETKARASQREQEYRKEVEAQSSEASQNARAAIEKLTALTQELARTEVRAPVDGTVVGLQMHTVGGVVAPGGRLMDIVPKDDTLVVEAQVPPLLIKRVTVGLPAQLRFTALDPKLTPVAFGKVITVSADALTDERGNMFFVARIEVPTGELAKLGYTKIQPGMPVETVIITGERSLLNYLFKPMWDRIARGMKEQ
jgi:protease secretion system membrane fusion protein